MKIILYNIPITENKEAMTIPAKLRVFAYDHLVSQMMPYTTIKQLHSKSALSASAFIIQPAMYTLTAPTRRLLGPKLSQTVFAET